MEKNGENGEKYGENTKKMEKKLENGENIKDIK